MNLTKTRRVFVHHIPKKKNLLHFLHRSNGLEKCPNNHLPQESCFTSRVTLGKSRVLLAGMSKQLS